MRLSLLLVLGVLGCAALSCGPTIHQMLIMDTASYKYPPTWVPLPVLYQAMNTTDSDSGRLRGYVEVSVNRP